MRWHDHSRDFPKGSHALFPPSQSGWLKDQSVEDVLRREAADKATAIGSALHELAEVLILTKVGYTKREMSKRVTEELVKRKISRSLFDPVFLGNNLCNYVNDAIGYRMDTEKALYYSECCAGTCDALYFDENKKDVLRIHDLKTGVTPAKFEQLEIYTALFFLEYGNEFGINPGSIPIELRIFQGGEILEEFPTAETIVPIMDNIIWHTKMHAQVKEG